ncbi:MAG: hypothetical protein ACLFM0_05830 [Spirochaetales bacterium]
MSEEGRQELLTSLDNEWHEIRSWNPVPGLFPQSGAETVKVRGSSEQVGETTITRYEIVVLDDGQVVGHYKVVAEEKLADYLDRFDE